MLNTRKLGGGKKKMKKIKVFLEAVVVITALLGLILPTSAVVTNTNPEIDKNDLNFIYMNEPINPINIGAGNVLISSDNPDNDDEHPKITRAGSTLLVTYEKRASILESSIPIAYSGDSGETWTTWGELIPESGLAINPDIYFNQETNEIFWSHIEPLDEYSGCMAWIDSDIANAEDFKFGACWNFGEDASEQALSNVGPYAVRWFIAPDQDEPQTPHLMYMRYDEELSYALPSDDGYGAFGSYYDGDENGAIDILPEYNVALAAGSDQLYGVFETEPIGEHKIGFKATRHTTDFEKFFTAEQVDACDMYADLDVWPFQQYLTENPAAVDPDIAAQGDSVAIVYTLDGQVKCLYTSTQPPDEEEHYGEYTFSESVVGDGGYPAIHMSGGKVYCAYINEGNLYQVISEDGGATWSEAVQLNEVDGTVVEESNSVDLNDLGTVWTDNRDGQKDIYIAAGGGDVPVLEIKDISGGIGVSATIENTGTAEATDVEWTITLDGTVFIGGEKTGTITTIAPEDSAAIKSGFPLGFGDINIAIKAESAEGATATATATGKLLLFFVTGL